MGGRTARCLHHLICHPHVHPLLLHLNVGLQSEEPCKVMWKRNVEGRGEGGRGTGGAISFGDNIGSEWGWEGVGRERHHRGWLHNHDETGVSMSPAQTAL